MTQRQAQIRRAGGQRLRQRRARKAQVAEVYRLLQRMTDGLTRLAETMAACRDAHQQLSDALASRQQEEGQ